jgi:hypothetical protein
LFLPFRCGPEIRAQIQAPACLSLVVYAGIFVLTARLGILIHPVQAKRKKFLPRINLTPARSIPPQAALLSHLLRYAQRNEKNHHALPPFLVARASKQNNSVELTIGYIMSL